MEIVRHTLQRLVLLGLIVGGALWAAPPAFAQNSTTTMPRMSPEARKPGVSGGIEALMREIREQTCQQSGFNCAQGTKCSPIGRQEGGVLYAYSCEANNCAVKNGCPIGFIRGNSDNRGGYSCQPDPNACSSVIPAGYMRAGMVPVQNGAGYICSYVPVPG